MEMLRNTHTHTHAYVHKHTLCSRESVKCNTSEVDLYMAYSDGVRFIIIYVAIPVMFGEPLGICNSQ